MKENIETVLVHQINEMATGIEKRRKSLESALADLEKDEKLLAKAKKRLSHVREKGISVSAGDVITNVENGRQMVVYEAYPARLTFDAVYPNEEEETHTFNYLDSTWRATNNVPQIELIINCICGNSTKLATKAETAWVSEGTLTSMFKMAPMTEGSDDVTIRCNKCQRELTIEV